MKRIKVSNFRKVKDTCEIELGPITFFTGPNNSGKSTILKALMVLSDYGKSNNHLELNFRGDNKWDHKIDCYQNAVNWDNFKKGMHEIQFSFDNRDFQTTLKFRPLIQPLKKIEKVQNGLLESISITRISDNSWFRMEHLDEDKFQINVEERFFENRRTDAKEEVEFLERNKADLERRIAQLEKQLADDNEKGLIDMTRTQIRLKEEIKKHQKVINDINQSIKKLLGEKKQSTDLLVFKPIFEMQDLRDGLPVIDRIIRMSLMKYFKENELNLGYTNDRNANFTLLRVTDKISNAINFSVDHLSPHRNSQTRLYINDEHTNDIYDLISRHSKNPIKKISEAGKFLKKWMKEFDIGDDYEIKPVEGIASIVEINEGNNKINLVDKGFGAGQIFTILLCIALKINEREKGNWPMTRERFLFSREALIMIEEPEANLHPALQSKLAELFYDAFFNYGIRFIIETHSEYILRKSQLIVKEINTKEDKKEQPFIVYYFDKELGPYQMHYRQDGAFLEEFGTGFFDESRKIVRKLL